MRHLVLFEPSDYGLGAYVPDLPGCVASGATREEVVRLMQEAIELHVAGLEAAAEPILAPFSESELLVMSPPAQARRISD